MALFTTEQLRNVAREKGIYKTAEILLLEKSRQYSDDSRSFDLFISHSSLDHEVILGLILTLEALKISVYVDWYVDPQLDRKNVTAATADLLRKRMRQSKALMYAYSENAAQSRWMPWECGYFDAHSGYVCVCPITSTTKSSFTGEEFLGLYPYVDGSIHGTVWVNNQSNSKYKSLGEWLSSSPTI